MGEGVRPQLPGAGGGRETPGMWPRGAWDEDLAALTGCEEAAEPACLPGGAGGSPVLSLELPPRAHTFPSQGRSPGGPAERPGDPRQRPPQAAPLTAWGTLSLASLKLPSLGWDKGVLADLRAARRLPGGRGCWVPVQQRRLLTDARPTVRVEGVLLVAAAQGACVCVLTAVLAASVPIVTGH